MGSIDLQNKILGLLYDRWFEDWLPGLTREAILQKSGASSNEVSAAIELLESEFYIESVDSLGYRITVSGIDRYERLLPPSAVGKRVEQRRQMLLLLKDLYVQDTSAYLESEELSQKMGISEYKELAAIAYYLKNSGLIDLQAFIGTKFKVRLNATGLQYLEGYRFDSSLAMANAYTLLFKLENHLRRFVEQKMLEAYGPNWWNEHVSKKVQDKADEYYQEEKKIVWQVSQTKGSMDYTLFTQLRLIIIDNWNEVFKGHFPNQDWIDLRLTELESIRNAIAHTRTLSDDAMTRLQAYYTDITNATTSKT